MVKTINTLELKGAIDMPKSKKISSGLSVDERTVVAEVTRIEGPRPSNYSGEYYTVRWQLDNDMRGHTHISSNYGNYRLWKSWLETAEPGSSWIVVISDDMEKHLPQDVLIDADYRAYPERSIL